MPSTAGQAGQVCDEARDAAGLHGKSEAADWRAHLPGQQICRDTGSTAGVGGLPGMRFRGSRALPGRGPAAGAHQAVGYQAEDWNDEHARGTGAGGSLQQGTGRGFLLYDRRLDDGRRTRPQGGLLRASGRRLSPCICRPWRGILPGERRGGCDPRAAARWADCAGDGSWTATCTRATGRRRSSARATRSRFRGRRGRLRCWHRAGQRT